jgi:hypothetical protein
MLELNEKEVVRLIALAGWNNPCAMVLAEMQSEEFMLFTFLIPGAPDTSIYINRAEFLRRSKDVEARDRFRHALAAWALRRFNLKSLTEIGSAIQMQSEVPEHLAKAVRP